MENYTILAIIPARGGSKGIPKKNIKTLHNKPLISYSIETALQTHEINHVVVTTEDEEIYKIANQYDIIVIKRPDELSKDKTPTLPVLQHAVEQIERIHQIKPDIIVLLQPTSPLRNVEDIKNCISKLIKEKCDSVITVKKIPHPIEWIITLDESKKIYNYFTDKKILRRQDSKEKIYLTNGAVYVFWYELLMKNDMIRGPNSRAVIMPEKRSIDIDTKLDFFIAEQLIKKEKNK